ncbi:RNA 2',3'-cyclic phosphodiesterase [Microbulbifer litoralis]|uniref:RNA 2',3'-cyclic phosphodiesterase n=1 Tax=Microbulbifer litoralis TaxID=2933965 RepID=UPI002027FCE0|nr:RNA 2',3'-cyclic phosphodiesterase [Microbulbifer sp. GX H0434]
MRQDRRKIPPGFSRLFIGVRPDARTQQFLDELANHCRQRWRTDRFGDTRWTSHGNRHLTLAFLGETPDGQTARIEDRLQQIAAQQPPCEARIVALQPFPQRRSRLLAAEMLPNPDLDRLHGACRRLMIDLGMKPESATYRPHITLARTRGGFAGFEPLATDFVLRLDNIALYQSHLAAGGSQYLPLYETPLAAT